MACNTSWLMLILFLCTSALIIPSSSGESEAKSLLKFKESLSNVVSLSNWDASISICNGNASNWKGLICSNGNVYGLRLEAMGLTGTIDVDALAKLPYLRSISLMNNGLDGPFPDVKKLGRLRGLYLSNNLFSGEIAERAFSGMRAIRRVWLANNKFTGIIPTSLTELPKIVDLQLQNNMFQGSIPSFVRRDLVVNLANNKLEGHIPAGLSDQNSTSFVGNNLCGKPLKPCKFPKKKTVPTIATIIAAIGVLGLAAIAIATFILRQRGRRPQTPILDNTSEVEARIKDVDYKEVGPPNQADKKHKKNEQQGKLRFLGNNDRERLELNDLLVAPAEVLGCGSFGSSYKTIMSAGPNLVVKRFRLMNNISREEFHEHMRRIGRLSHPNLLPLSAFYYSRDEKLLISKFVEKGSLASHLHSNRSPDQAGLDWPTRLKIIKGVAKGLGYIYKELPWLTLPHGHLKSSNVLLDGSFNPLIAEYALVPVINREQARQFMVAFKSPESFRSGTISRKTDVWGLGILILETLTGNFPANYLSPSRGGDDEMVKWAESVAREEGWAAWDVFDRGMEGTRDCEGEMMKLLKIGICCCEMDVERRLDMEEVVERIEELKVRDDHGRVEDRPSFSFSSEGDVLLCSKDY